jgi:SAM-dependent MidA family methyltransferase
MSVARYMALCLGHPVHGYYRQPHSIGAAGDFITAPEISQIFGELIGLWAAVVWQQMGKPDRVQLVELGPGRGTLMHDALRAARLMPAFRAALQVGLVEFSGPMRQAQDEQLRGAGVVIHWADTAQELLADVAADVPVILIANEFLDALPIEQAIKAGGSWQRRAVGVGDDGYLVFTTDGVINPPAAYDNVTSDGAIAEWRPDVRPLLATLAQRRDRLAALFIDYGHERTLTGDTLQSVGLHQATDVLAAPGEHDLTAQVDFAALAQDGESIDCVVDGPVTQATFLGALGAVERGSRLMSQNPAQAGSIEAGLARLMAAPGMGSRFKVLGLRTAGLPPLPGL